ncbi:MAG: phosphatase PAP2 family protein [Rhodocyclaceae bacterium]|jgi:undecaprenyl-diphosphatase|nr:phosphatase PAP2 family protein [Rhodocyclaceae bacterium]
MDAAWLALMDAWRHPVLTAGLGALTWLGSLAVLLPLALAAGARRAADGWRGFAFLPAAVLGAAGVAQLLKRVVDRERPDLFPSLVAMPADASFPSAHAMQAAAFVTAWLLWRGAARRPGLVACGAVLVLAVGLSRTYLQVHFLSDVLFGIVAGVAWATLLHALPVWRRA